MICFDVFEIYNIWGVKVYSSTLIDKKNQLQIDLDLPGGQYYYLIKSDGLIINTDKFVIIR